MSIYLVLKMLVSRKKFTKYVCITGGEPTIYSDLPDFVRLLYNDGFKIKLDTNGLNSDILEECLPYLDYVAMDIKTNFKKYPILEDRKLSQFSKFSLKDRIEFYRNRLLYSIGMIMTSGVDYEFRTTVVPGLVDSEDILDIGSYISGAKRYVLQQFIPSQAYSKEYRKIVPYSKRILDSFKEKLEPFKIKEILIKNV
jgi:pyruvate formate lyase activating enzyme